MKKYSDFSKTMCTANKITNKFIKTLYFLIIVYKKNNYLTLIVQLLIS